MFCRDLSGNDIALIPDLAFDAAMNLSVLDLRDNSPSLTGLPPMWHHYYLDTIYIDEGAACCMYETDWKWSEGESTINKFYDPTTGPNNHNYHIHVLIKQ